VPSWWRPFAHGGSGRWWLPTSRPSGSRPPPGSVPTKWSTRAREAPEQILDLTGGGADLVIEASGSDAGLAAALAAVARGGRLLLVGLQSQPRAIDLHRMVIHEIEIFTTNAHVCDADLPAAIALLAERDLAALVVDREIPLERLVPDGLLAMAGGQATGKVIVNPTRRN